MSTAAWELPDVDAHIALLPGLRSVKPSQAYYCVCLTASRFKHEDKVRFVLFRIEACKESSSLHASCYMHCRAALLRMCCCSCEP
jgi:hypothetical protein